MLTFNAPNPTPMGSDNFAIFEDSYKLIRRSC
jgi:hypothetical protein